MSPPATPTVPTPAWEDASFGLDPSADISHHLEGRRWLPPSLTTRRDATEPGGPTQLSTLLRSAGSWRSSSSAGSFKGQGRKSVRSRTSSKPDTGREARTRRSSLQSASSGDDRDPTTYAHPPTRSLTFSLLSPSAGTVTRRMSLLASSVFINVVLPFANGLMLGTGESVARALIVPGVLLVWRWALAATARTK